MARRSLAGLHFEWLDTGVAVQQVPLLRSPPLGDLRKGNATPLGFFVFFIASGFCSLLYQVVWLRLAMASFGVTAPMVSIVLSLFMAGLALGSWGAGRLVAARPGWSALRLYALSELSIGASGLLVAPGIRFGRAVISRFGAGVAWGSLTHYVLAGIWLSLLLLPFCIAMGATLPLAMAAVRRMAPGASERSFSYLYLANVVGACLGTLGSAFLMIETLGFRGTLLRAAVVNALVAAAALLWSFARSQGGEQPKAETGGGAPAGGSIPLLLFLTGLVSMGAEVIWVRQYTPYLGTVVYSFATILAVYLLATFSGTIVYRLRHRGSHEGAGALGVSWPLLGVLCLLPVISTDPRVPLGFGFVAGIFRLLVGLVPFCAALGYWTPLLVDRHSRGDARRAGSVYALNVVGCVLGPLLAGFVLLPRLGERYGLLILALLFVASAPVVGSSRRTLVASAAICLFAALGSDDYIALIDHPIVRRDYTATVVAAGTGRAKRLLENGIWMTSLKPDTKLMAHLPLVLHQRERPETGLVICFGMGTSFRSQLSWGLKSTAIELVPSVPELFSFFHSDAPALLASGRGRIVVDDGRRFLERTGETFDVIVIDPPPPVEAAGSSLLYSKEFYEVIAPHLKEDGILQQWLPSHDRFVAASFARALRSSFPYVRVFPAIKGGGYHFLASGVPIPTRSPREAAARLPEAAAADLIEWGPDLTPEAELGRILKREIPVGRLLRKEPGARALDDDRPINEYYFLRRVSDGTLRDLEVTRLRGRVESPRPAGATQEP